MRSHKKNKYGDGQRGYYAEYEKLLISQISSYKIDMLGCSRRVYYSPPQIEWVNLRPSFIVFII